MLNTPNSIQSARQKIAVVTGTVRPNGLGFHTALALARKNYHVVFVARNFEKIEASIKHKF